jgi:hypothetical protein
MYCRHRKIKPGLLLAVGCLMSIHFCKRLFTVTIVEIHYTSYCFRWSEKIKQKFSKLASLYEVCAIRIKKD